MAKTFAVGDSVIVLARVAGQLTGGIDTVKSTQGGVTIGSGLVFNQAGRLKGSASDKAGKDDDADSDEAEIFPLGMPGLTAVPPLAAKGTVTGVSVPSHWHRLQLRKLRRAHLGF